MNTTSQSQNSISETVIFLRRFSSRALRVIIVLSFLVAMPDLRAELKLTDLTCGYAVNPLGVDELNPSLSWKLHSELRGEHQTAYQILAASSQELLSKDSGDLWDSGKVASGLTAHIRYAGKPAGTGAEVFWKVRSWGKNEQPSVWSETATWTAGVVGLEEWPAKWICAPAATEALLLRREFVVRPNLKRAVAFVSGLGQYEMSLNGAKSGAECLSPGWTDYKKTILYDTQDITSQLKVGTNAVGLALGNGMYNVVRRNRYVKFTGYSGPLRAICQIQLHYNDGSKEMIGTDENWRSQAGPVVFSSIYGGEDFDARLLETGWNMPGFDDSNWPSAVLLVRPSGTLRGESAAAPALRAMATNHPVVMLALTNGETLYDLGRNTAHVPLIQVTGPKGSAVRLIPSEITNEDGTINQSTMGAGRRGSSWWQYTKGTDAEEVWSPQFSYIGCRYMQAKTTAAKNGGAPAQIKSLEGLAVHSSAAALGKFECSNELLNRIHLLVRAAQEANMVSVLTDCPHREKLGWLEQYHLNGPSLRYEFDLASLFNKGMNDMAEAQLPNGLVPNIAPEYTVFNGTFRAAVEWGSSFIIVPWQQYQFNGDTDLMRRHFEGMKKYFDYLETRATNDILSEGLGDWYDLGPKKPGFAQLTPIPATATAFYFYDATLLSQMATVLGKKEDAAHFETCAERIRTNYNRVFFNEAKHAYASGSQAANAIPLVFGMVEAANREAVLDSLVKDVAGRDYAVTAGDVGYRYLLQALAAGGRSDVIYKMINRDDKPGYGYQLKKGATSLCESWDANNSSSHDHFMLGQIIEWFYKDLAGIGCDPEGPGFKKIIIHPEPVENLKTVKASYDSQSGEVAVLWRHDNGKFNLNMTIPAGTTATVFMPTKSAVGITESGKLAKDAEGVHFVREEGDRAVFLVESGSYEFESDY